MNKVTTLQYGHHSSSDDGMCLLEAVSYIAGEPFSDHPACVCPVLASFGRVINDCMGSEQRQELLPYVVKLLNTLSTQEVERRRAFIFTDAAVRIFTTMSLDKAGLHAEAETLRNLPEVADRASANCAADRVRRAAEVAGEARAVWSTAYCVRMAAHAAMRLAGLATAAANAAALGTYKGAADRAASAVCVGLQPDAASCHHHRQILIVLDRAIAAS